MKQVYFCKVSPGKMSDQQKDDLVGLHQKYISLSREAILAHLQNRNKVYLYYHRATKILIGTAGIQYIICKNQVFIYIGNTVVDEQFKHEGCTAHAIWRSVVVAFIRHPLKKKHWCALTSSPGSFSYSQRYQPCWPNPDEQTPQDITETMEQCIHKIGISDYKILEGNIVTSSLCDKIGQTFHLKVNTVQTRHSAIFNKLNPNAEKGEQLFFINLVCIYKLINAAIFSLHHRLVGQPTLYRRLKKNRNKNSLRSGFNFLNNMISSWAKTVTAGIIGTVLSYFYFF